MHDALAALARAAGTATPTPTPSTVDPELVTPGAEGFVITAVVAIVTILLVWDMIRRIRRGRVRAEINEELDAQFEAEEQAARAQEATEADGRDIDPEAPGASRRG